MKEDIQEKYSRLRSSIKHGDVILFHGTEALAKIIQESDSDAYFNHIGIVGEMSGVLFIVDSNAPGVHPERLSVRINRYAESGGDFAIRRSKKTSEEIDTAFYNVMNTLEKEGEVKYDFVNGLKSLLNRRFKTKFKINPKEDRMICSMFVYPYLLELEMVRVFLFNNTLFFPQDAIRYGINSLDITK